MGSENFFYKQVSQQKLILKNKYTFKAAIRNFVLVVGK